MQVDQPIRHKRTVQRRSIEMPTMPVAPRPHKTTKPGLHVPVNLFERYPRVSKAEVIAPTNQKPVDIANYLFYRQLYPADCQLMYSASRPFQALGRRDYVQIPSRSVQTAIKTERKPEEIKTAARLFQVDDGCLVSIQDQVVNGQVY